MNRKIKVLALGILLTTFFTSPLSWPRAPENRCPCHGGTIAGAARK